MKRYILDNARMILKYAGLSDDEMALCLNRIYKHYSGDDIFAIAGIEFANNYVRRLERKPVSAEIKQLTFDESEVK